MILKSYERFQILSDGSKPRGLKAEERFPHPGAKLLTRLLVLIASLKFSHVTADLAAVAAANYLQISTKE